MNVSIIIPAYNASEYLDECLESIVSQTYKALEVIIVDDGSTDATPTICDAWASRDKRVSVIHQRNCGPATSRNNGLRMSTGNWVWFVDADDIVESDAVELLLNDALSYKPDIVIMDIRPFGPEGDLARSLVARRPFPEGGKVSGKRLMELYSSSSVESFVCSMFFNASFLKSFKGIGTPFVEGCRMLEDMAFMWQIAAMEPTVYFEERKLYGYRQVSSSLIHKVDLRNASSGYEALRLVNSLRVPPEIKLQKDVKTLSCLLMVDGQAGSGSGAAGLHRAIRTDILRLWRSIGITNCSIAMNIRCALVVMGVITQMKSFILFTKGLRLGKNR